jgi:hypothetical protein
VHSGTSCENSSIQEGHLKTLSGLDPWAKIRYSSTSANGDAMFVFAVSTDNAFVSGRAFVVHDSDGARVACGVLSSTSQQPTPENRTQPESTSVTTVTTTITTTISISFSSYPAYTTTFTELGGSGVYGSVAVFVTPTGLVGAGHAKGLEPDLVAGAAAGSPCTARNGCGLHVHSGTGCNTSSQGGHYFVEYSDPWANARYRSTNSVGDATFSFSVLTVSTAIEGKPFIVHNNAGARVACGILSFVKQTSSAKLNGLNDIGVVGGVTLHTTQDMIMGVGWATGLEYNLMGLENGGTDCTRKNGCGTHVHSGLSCDSTESQGGHLTTSTGADPWTTVGYSSTSPTGFAYFAFAVMSDSTDVADKPFVLHNNDGDRVSCGLLRSTSLVYVADLSPLGNSGVSGRITISLTPMGLVGAGHARGLERYLAVGSNCNAENGCGAHVHSGHACTNSSTQGGHYYSTSVDPWLQVKYTSTDSVGNASFTFSVIAGVSDIKGKPFIVHNNVGSRVSCGILSLAAESEDKDAQIDAKSSSPLGLVAIIAGCTLLLLIACMCLCWSPLKVRSMLRCFWHATAKDNSANCLPERASQTQSNGEEIEVLDEEPTASISRNVSRSEALTPARRMKSSSTRNLSRHDQERSNMSWQRDDQKSWRSEEDEVEGAFEV